MKRQDIDIPKDRLTGVLRRGAVKKHVAAIHVSGKLTLLQRKLSNVLLLNAYDTLTSQQVHMIDARTLCLMIGYNSNDMDTLKQSLRGLAETVAEWDMLDDKGQQEWGVSKNAERQGTFELDGIFPSLTHGCSSVKEVLQWIQ